MYIMNQRLKIPSPWAQLGLFMLLFGGCLVFTGVVLYLIPGSTTNMGKVQQAVSSVGMFGLPAYLYAVMTSGEQPLRFLGFKKAPLSVFYALGVLLLLLSFPFEGWLGQLNRQLPMADWMIRLEKMANEQLSKYLKVETPMDIVVNVIVIAAIPAVFEEVCFRGALQRILIHCFKSPWAGILFTGAFFSAFHMQFAGFLPRMFLGVLLGAAYWYSGSLWVAILGHFVTNATQVIAVSYYPKMMYEDPYVPIYWAMLSLVIVVGLLAILQRRSTASYAGVYATTDHDADGFPY